MRLKAGWLRDTAQGRGAGRQGPGPRSWAPRPKAEELGDTAFAPALRAILETILRCDARKPAWADSTLALRLGEVERRLDVVTARGPAPGRREAAARDAGASFGADLVPAATRRAGDQQRLGAGAAPVRDGPEGVRR